MKNILKFVFFINLKILKYENKKKKVEILKNYVNIRNEILKISKILILFLKFLEIINN